MDHQHVQGTCGAVPVTGAVGEIDDLLASVRTAPGSQPATSSVAAVGHVRCKPVAALAPVRSGCNKLRHVAKRIARVVRSNSLARSLMV